MSSAVQVSPVFQEVTLDGSADAVVREIVITNTSTTPLTVTPLVGEVAAGQDGPPAGVPAQLFPELPYLKVYPATTQLPANATASVTVRFEGSTQLSPGGHYAAVVLMLSERAGAKAQVIPGVSSSFFLTRTGGETRKLELVQAKLPRISIGYPKAVSLTLKNTGNTHLVPHGRVIIGSDERLISRGLINQDSRYIFPGQERMFAITMEGINATLPIARSTWQVEARNAAGEVTTLHSSSILILQPSFFAMTALCLCCIAVFLRRRVRKKHL